MSNIKYTGTYYTPYPIAEFIFHHLKEALSKQKKLSILEPSVGDGVFIDAFNNCKAFDKDNNVTFTAVEKNLGELEKARKKAANKRNPNTRFIFKGENFLEWQKDSIDKYSFIAGNPPYIKSNLLHVDHIDICNSIHETAGLTTLSIKNIWATFLIRSVSLLSDDGIISMVLPAELLQSNFSKPIRDLLVTTFERIEIFTFNELIFKGIGQDTIIIFCYKKATNKGTFFVNIKDDSELTDGNFVLAKNDIVDASNIKWTHHILNNDEIELLNTLKLRLQNIGYYCNSKPGIVTAANKYFIVNSETEERYELSNFSNPIIQKGFFVDDTVVFDQRSMDDLIASGRPSKFLHFKNDSVQYFSTKNLEYLKIGIEEDIPSRYKCIKRNNWFVVPNIPFPPDGFFFKRTHQLPKMVKNEALVNATDSAYLIDMNNGYDMQSLIYSFYNSLSIVFCEMSGRYYGGGVLELTPKEFKSIPIPYLEITDDVFNSFRRDFENKRSSIEIVNNNDQTVLANVLGLDADTIRTIQIIKEKLLNKRLRKN